MFQANLNYKLPLLNSVTRNLGYWTDKALKKGKGMLNPSEGFVLLSIWLFF